jgi:hypothetical protein
MGQGGFFNRNVVKPVRGGGKGVPAQNQQVQPVLDYSAKTAGTIDFNDFMKKNQPNNKFQSQQ